MSKFNFPTEPLDLQKTLGEANIEDLLKAIAIKMCELEDEIISNDPEDYEGCSLIDLAIDYAKDEQSSLFAGIQGYIQELATVEAGA